jgi:hypothetical protein
VYEVIGISIDINIYRSRHKLILIVNPFTAIGTGYAVPVIFGVFAIWTALAVSIKIMIIIIN